MVTVEAAIWLAIKARVDSLVLDPPMQVYEPDAIVNPDADSSGPLPFILLGDARNETRRLTISGDMHVRSGTAIINVQWPITRSATHTQLMQIGGKIAEHFTADTCMRFGPVSLRVMRDADVLQPFLDGAIRSIPIRIPWSNM